MKAKVCLLTILTLLAAAGASVAYLLRQPYAGFPAEVFLDIPKGTTTPEMARSLARNGVVRYEWQFLLVRALRPSATLQAGEYRFDRPASPWHIYERIVRGDVLYHELTVPEGSNMFDIAAALEELGIITAGEFLEAATQPEMIRDLAPEAPTLEGYLFPSTYRITRHAVAADVCRQMTDQFRQVWQQLSTSDGVHETVTLASLVEKEAAVAEERPLIASVFRNRLRKQMKLECDPTTIYAALLEDRYRGVIHRSDLENQHSYNTYQHAGLPPGPIANPGFQSLRAALEPAETDYLFFVVKPDGTGAHEFSTTVAAHNRAVWRFRRGIKEAVNQEPGRPVSGQPDSGANQ